jgi:hypothetical protein
VLKLPITYTDFNDVTKTEDFHFHMSVAELTNMGLATAGTTFGELVRRMTATGDTGAIMDAFKEVILRSVGQRSPEGDKFYKNERIQEDFVACGAYDALFLKLLTDTTEIIRFVNGVMPTDMQKNPEFQKALAGLQIQALTPEAERVRDNPDDYSRQELVDMPREQFDALVGTDTKKMSKAHLSILMERVTSGKDE